MTTCSGVIPADRARAEPSYATKCTEQQRDPFSMRYVNRLDSSDRDLQTRPNARAQPYHLQHEQSDTCICRRANDEVVQLGVLVVAHVVHGPAALG